MKKEILEIIPIFFLLVFVFVGGWYMIYHSTSEEYPFCKTNKAKKCSYYRKCSKRGYCTKRLEITPDMRKTGKYDKK